MVTGRSLVIPTPMNFFTEHAVRYW